MTTPKQLAAFIANHQDDTLEKVQKEGYFKEMESLDRLYLQVGLESEFQVNLDDDLNESTTIETLTTAINAKTH